VKRKYILDFQITGSIYIFYRIGIQQNKTLKMGKYLNEKVKYFKILLKKRFFFIFATIF